MLPLSSSSTKISTLDWTAQTTLDHAESYSLEDDTEINDHCYSLDNRSLAIGAADGNIKLYKIENLNFVHTLKREGTGEVLGIAFSPDGKILASASEDAKLALWRVSDGELLHILEGHNDWAWSVSFSLDGKLLASGSEDGTVKIWSMESKKVLRTIATQGDPIFTVNFLPNSETLSSTSRNGTEIQWGFEGGIKQFGSKSTIYVEQVIYPSLPEIKHTLIDRRTESASHYVRQNILYGKISRS